MAGAFVVLLGSSLPSRYLKARATASTDAAATLTDSAGRFLLTAPGAGAYRLRIQRIGYRTITTQPFNLTAGQTSSHTVAVGDEPIRLAGIEVKSERGAHCALGPDSANMTQRLWDQVQTALSVARWTARHRSYRFDGSVFDRHLDPSGRLVQTHQIQRLQVYADRPFRSARVEQLVDSGYVQERDSTVSYYGPDPETLLAPSFRATHCFRVEPPREGTHDLIGLSFAPVPGRKVPDIRGTFWIRESTAVLREIDFGYTFLELPKSVRDRVGGQIQLQRLPGGEWIISRWKLVTPMFYDMHPGASRQDKPLRLGKRLAGLRAHGAVIQKATPNAPLRIPGARELVAAPHLSPAADSLLAELTSSEAAAESGGTQDSASRASAPHRPDRTSPDLGPAPPALDSALEFFRAPPDSAEVAGLATRLERARGGEASSADLWALAELWRRAGRTEEALRTLAGLGDDLPMVRLERARILFSASGVAAPGSNTAAGFASGEGPDLGVAAAAVFWSACEQMDGRVKEALWRDLRGLATPVEQARWDSMAAGPATCALVRDMVEERAWRMGVSAETRLAVHYRRLDHARRWYWLRERRRQRDLADRLGRPPGLDVDDRGLLYLRMGPPDRTITSTEPGGEIHPNETWVYDGPEGRRIYNFAPVSRVGGAGVTDYRLLENLARAGGELRDLYASRQSISGVYRRLLQDLVSQQLARGSDSSLAPGHPEDLAEERHATYRAARHAIREIPDRPSVRAKLRMAAEALRFRGPEPGRTEVWFLATVRAGDLEAVRQGEGWRYAPEATLALRAGDSVVTRTWGRPVEAERRLDGEDGLPLRSSLMLPPGRYPYSLLTRDLESGVEGGEVRTTKGEPAGAWVRDTLVAPEWGGAGPEVSDIAVAADSGGSWTRDGRTFLRVTPTHVTGPHGSLHVYFEVYGIPAGERYETEVRLVPAKNAGRIYRLPADAVAYQARFTSEMPAGDSPVGRHHLRLQLAGTPEGHYVLGVRVRVSASGATSLPSVTDVYR